MKKTLTYFAFFIAGATFATIIILNAAASMQQKTTEGIIYGKLVYIEKMEESDFRVNREVLTRDAEVGLSVLRYRLDSVFTSCTKNTMQTLRMAKQYIDADKIPFCD